MKSWLLVVLCILAVSANAQNLQDPTKPLVNSNLQTGASSQKDNGSQGFELTAIMIREQHKQAIINGQSVEEGQILQDYQVISISQHKVVLSGVDGEQSLVINKNNVKKDINNDF